MYINSQLQCQDCLTKDWKISRRYHPTRHQSFMTLHLPIQLHRDSQEDVKQEEDHHYHGDDDDDDKHNNQNQNHDDKHNHDNHETFQKYDKNHNIYQRRFSTTTNFNILNTKNSIFNYYSLSTTLHHYTIINKNHNIVSGVDDNDSEDDFIDVKGGSNNNDSNQRDNSNSHSSSKSSSRSRSNSNGNSMNVMKGRSSSNSYMNIYSCLDEYFKVDKLTEIQCNACLVRHAIKLIDTFDRDHYPHHHPCNNDDVNDDRSISAVHNDNDIDNDDNHDIYDNDKGRYCNINSEYANKEPHHSRKKSVMSDSNSSSSRDSINSNNDLTTIETTTTATTTTTTTTNYNNNNNTCDDNDSNRHKNEGVGSVKDNVNTSITSSTSGVPRNCYENIENNYINNKISSSSRRSSTNVNLVNNYNDNDNNIINSVAQKIKSLFVSSKNDSHIQDLTSLKLKNILTPLWDVLKKSNNTNHNSNNNYNSNNNNSCSSINVGIIASHSSIENKNHNNHNCTTLACTDFDNNNNNHNYTRSISTTANTSISEQKLLSLSNIHQSKLNKSIVMKYSSIARLPSLLCLYLCRRTYVNENNNYCHKIMKLNHHITFPIILNMSRYCYQQQHHQQQQQNNNDDDDDDDSDSNNYKYNLKAVVVHQGNADGGELFYEVSVFCVTITNCSV